MRTKLLLLSIAMLTLIGPVCAQANRTIHQVFDCREATEIDLAGLGGKVEIRERGGSRVLIEMNVLLENGSYKLLDLLTTQDHFGLDMTLEGGSAKIFRKIKPTRFKTGPNDEIPDVIVTEFVNYVVYVPPRQLGMVRITEEQKTK